MKTLLFATAYAETTEQLDRRVGRWVRHHQKLPWPVEAEVRLAVCADGMPDEVIWPDGDYHRVNLTPRLGRPGHLQYPGWWRSFAQALTFARAIEAERIWHVESDFFIASHRMIEALNRARSWTAFWCPRHNFPETGIQVIANDAFGRFEDLTRRLNETNFASFNGRHAEHVLPIDRVERSLTGDRYGEAGIDPRSIPGLDFYGQLNIREGDDFEPYFRATG